MKIEDKYIKTAIDSLTKVKEPIVNNNIYKKVFKGYISELGASIMQAGLLPSIIFYENSQSAQQDKKKLISAIIYILNTDFGYEISVDLSLYILRLSSAGEKIKLLKDVEKAAVAIKLALRIFKSDTEEE